MTDIERLPCGVEHELRADAAIIRSWIDVANGPINREALADRLDRYANAAAAQSAEIEALRAEVVEWKRVAAAQAELHDEAEARVKRLEKRLSAYQAAVNKIDDLIEYALPMPRETKAALYAVLADLTDALVEGSKHEQDQ